MEDKRASSNGQVANPRIIIDASYIRGMKKDGAPLRAMCEQGGRIVLIDTLVYELCSTDDRNQWLASKLKLVECREAVEVWKHVSELYRFELKENRPCGDPLDLEVTERFQEMLADNPQYRPDDFPPQRESSAILKLFKNLTKLNNDFEGITAKIKGKAPNDKEIVQTCYDAINDPDSIRSMIKVIKSVVEKDIEVSLDPNDVDKTWAIWHFSKSLLTLLCDCLRQGEDVFREISEKRKKRLENIIRDLDYLILLAFADAIATRETKGEMSYYRRWMFGDYSKSLIRCYENERIVFFVRELKQMSKIAINIVEQLDGYTCALDPRSRASLKIQDSETLPASLFISYYPKGYLGNFEFIKGPMWRHVAEILTGYPVSELQNFGGVVFVDPSTRETLFEPSVQYAQEKQSVHW